MLPKEGASFLRLLSGAYGIVSTFLPWLISNEYGSITLWFTFPGSFSTPYPWYQNVPDGVLTYISNVFTITLAVIIFGCLMAFVSGFTAGIKGKWLALSSGLAFSSAGIIFLLGLTFLFVSGDIRGTPFASSPVASGFCMAFVAAAPAFASIGSKRNVMFFFLIWGVLWITFASILFIYTFPRPPGPALFVSFLFSLIFTSISACLYGVFKLVKNKLWSLHVTHRGVSP